jgi:DNA polymerase type B, organellar and viral
LEAILSIGLTPTVIAKGSQVKKIQLQNFALRIIPRQGFFTGSLNELIKQMSLPCKLDYFPVQINHPYFYTADISPTLADFHEFFDTAIESACKEAYFRDYVHGILRLAFANELYACTLSKLKVLTLGTLTFFKNCFDLQIKCIQLFGESESVSLVSPYTGIFSTPTYVFSCFLLHALPEKTLYVINNEFGKRPQVSKFELQYSEYLRNRWPGRFLTAFSHDKNELLMYRHTYPDIFDTKLSIGTWINGCWTHSHHDKNCPLISKVRNKKVFNKTFERNSDDFYKKKKLFIEKYKSVVKGTTSLWECRFNVMKEKNKHLKTFLATTILRPIERICPRNSVKSALNDVFSLQALSDDTMQIYYLDCVSLYPTVALKFPLPWGKYQIIFGDALKDEDITFENGSYFYKSQLMHGLGHVTVVPPTNLFLPVLLTTINNHSVATLCYQCAKSKSLGKCSHDDRQRSFSDTYIIPELNLARRLNYKIKFHEIYFYPNASHYLKKFIQLLAFEKIRFSGFPHQMTEGKEQLFCQDLNERMEFDQVQLKLSREMIEDNPKYRFTYKAFLNSFLGKFLQNSSKFQQTIFARNNEEIVGYFKGGNLTGMNVINEEICQLLVAKNFGKNPQRNVNCCIGAYILGLARIYMFDKLFLLKESKAVLHYVDTDAVLFSLPKNVEIPISVGNAFGDFRHNYENVRAFCALAPKCYSLLYTVDHNLMYNDIKLSGFNLKQLCSRFDISHDDFTRFVGLIVKKEFAKICVPQIRYQIKANKKIKVIQAYRFFRNLCYNKRQLADNFNTLPFGMEQL